jgi:hypothetical protein
MEKGRDTMIKRDGINKLPPGLSDKDIENIRLEINRAKDPVLKKRVGRKTVPRRMQSDYIKTTMSPTIVLANNQSFRTSDGKIKRGDQVTKDDQIFNNRARVRPHSFLKDPEDWQTRQDTALRAWSAELRGQGVEVYHCIRHKTMRGNFKWFFHGPKYFWQEYSEDWTAVIKRSIIYHSKDSLMNAFLGKCIQWLPEFDPYEA